MAAPLGALFLSLAVVVPTALLGLASAAAAATLDAPDRASVPAEIHASEAHALPGDATNVRIDMTENDGLDVIVAASGGGRVGAGSGQRAPPCASSSRAGDVERRHGSRAAADPGPPGVDESDHAHGVTDRGRAADTVCRAAAARPCAAR